MNTTKENSISKKLMTQQRSSTFASVSKKSRVESSMV